MIENMLTVVEHLAQSPFIDLCVAGAVAVGLWVSRAEAR